MQLNKRPKLRTHEGAPAKSISPEQELERSVLSCFLWENTFYEDGQSIAERIAELVGQVPSHVSRGLAIKARINFKLRHAPLWILAAMLKHKKMDGLATAIPLVIQRPDELCELLAMYWQDGRKPLPAQLKKGLAAAFVKFDEYQLAKYNRPNPITLRDVMFLVHPKPENLSQESTWKQLANKTLKSPDTWEVALSAGADKRQTFERLLTENKLGALALLRNLRNMVQSNVNEILVREAILSMNASRVLPFRFIAAAKHAPSFESELESSLFRCVSKLKKLPGITVILIDVSGSMTWNQTTSDMTNLDRACGVGMIARELCTIAKTFTFSQGAMEVPPRRGFALRDAIVNSQFHGGTCLGNAIEQMRHVQHDRLIVITDEQSHDRVPEPTSARNYIINIASYKNGIGYGPRWTHIDGFSEAVFKFITEYEAQPGQEGEPYDI